jgi:hypothetical protein
LRGYYKNNKVTPNLNGLIRTREAAILRSSFVEEVVDSKIRIKSVTVEEKILVVQEGMERVLGSHRL